MSEDAKKPARKLGRGLSALLGEINVAPVAVQAGQGGGTATVAPASTLGGTGDGITMVAVAAMRPMPGQPRRNFEEGAIAELAQSIKERGLLQPIVVRDVEGSYQIVAGERRWRAAQVAQIHQVPVIVREFDDRTALEIALVENIQREQLNAWEEGETYRRLIDEFGHGQEALAKIVGKSRSHIANLIRLRDLPQSVHGWLVAGDLTMGHARALLLTDDPVALAKQVIARGLSVRETERLAKANKPGARPAGKSSAKMTSDRDPDLAALERQLGDMMGLKVRIEHGARGGTVTLGYSSLDQLDLICQRLSGDQI